MRVNVDIETALYNKLAAEGYSASAHAIPSTLGDTLPHIHVVRTGGYTSDMVVESHSVDFDVYAGDNADAMRAAADLCGWVRELAGGELETPCYESEVTTLPYQNPDPSHPNIARATFKAQIIARTKGANYA